MNNSVPTGWSLQPLSALAHYYNGRAFKPEDWSSEGLPIIRIAQINNKNTDLDYYAGDDVSDKNRIINGDLLFSWSATLTALIWNRGDAVLNQHIFKVEEKAGVDRKYLHQVILNSIEPLADYSHGSTMKHIKKGVLDEYCVGTPPLHEQQKIATILSSVDNVIEKTRAQIDKLKDLKTGMMQELLTKGIGHTEFKESPVGRIPVAWEVAELSSVTKVIDCKHATPKYFDEGFPVMKPGNIKEGNINLLGCALTDEDGYKNLNENHKPCKGDTVYSRNQTYGIGAYVNENMDFAIGQDVCVIHPVSCFPKFIYYAVNAPVVRDQVELLAAGSTFKRINLGSIRKLNIPIPPNHEQVKIASVLSSFDSKISVFESKQLANLDLKKALMQDLLTGKVRVNLTDKESAVV